MRQTGDNASRNAGASAAMGHCELQPRRTHGMVTRLELRIARWAKIAPPLSFRHQSGV
jgi:hypothetical protein